MDRRTLLGGLLGATGGLLAGCLGNDSNADSPNDDSSADDTTNSDEERNDNSEEYNLLVKGMLADNAADDDSAVPADDERIEDVELINQLIGQMNSCDLEPHSTYTVIESPPDSDAAMHAHEAIAELSGSEPPAWGHSVYIDLRGCTIRIELAKMHEDG